MFIHQSFVEKRYFLWHMEKRQKKGHINSNFVAPKIVFFTHAAKKFLFSQTWWINIKCLDVYQYFFPKICEHFEKRFLGSPFFPQNLWTPMSQSEFSLYYIFSKDYLELSCCRFFIMNVNRNGEFWGSELV
jgi:hypothetical protein